MYFFFYKNPDNSGIVFCCVWNSRHFLKNCPEFCTFKKKSLKFWTWSGIFWKSFGYPEMLQGGQEKLEGGRGKLEEGREMLEGGQSNFWEDLKLI